MVVCCGLTLVTLNVRPTLLVAPWLKELLTNFATLATTFIFSCVTAEGHATAQTTPRDVANHKAINGLCVDPTSHHQLASYTEVRASPSPSCLLRSSFPSLFLFSSSSFLPLHLLLFLTPPPPPLSYPSTSSSFLPSTSSSFLPLHLLLFLTPPPPPLSLLLQPLLVSYTKYIHFLLLAFSSLPPSHPLSSPSSHSLMMNISPQNPTQGGTVYMWDFRKFQRPVSFKPLGHTVWHILFVALFPGLPHF